MGYSYSNNLLDHTTGCQQVYYQYDAHGNMVNKVSPNNETLSLSFDSANRLRSINGTNTALQYSYDGLGNRVQTNNNGVSSYSLHDNNGRRLLRTTSGVTAEYYYLDSQLVASTKQAAITYYHWDILGNTIAASDAGGNLLWRKAYQVFGLDIHGQSNDNKAPGFVNKEYNQDTGLSYFGQRYYEPSLGRFLSIDPVAVVPDNIFSFNRYAYGNNNPYRYKDLDGRAATLVLGGELGFLVGGPPGAVVGIVAGTVIGAGGYLLVDNYYNQLNDESNNSNELSGSSNDGNNKEPNRNISSDTSPVATKGSFSKYIDLTKSRSKVPNKQTNVPKNMFEKNLIDSGYTKSVSKDGKVNLFTKGSKSYTTRTLSKSTKGPTAEVFMRGKIASKIRLGD